MDMIVDVINSIDAFVWGPPMLAVFLLGVFRAGYIPSGFIYTQF